MESEKVEEIKLALEIAIKTGECRKQDTYLGPVKLSDILEYINELESEKERLNKSEIGELIKENEELAKQCVEWSELDFKKRNKITELKDQITELEDGIAKSMLGCEFLPECTNVKLKQFAERVGEKLKENVNGENVDYFVSFNILLSETLKEFTE